MDAAGADSAIRHIMSGINPQGCQVFSFKQPIAKALDHDFFSVRPAICLNADISAFFRSYYVEVPIVRVHPKILRIHGLPDELLDEGTIWQERYRSILDLKNHLYRNGTRVIKFYLRLLVFLDI